MDIMDYYVLCLSPPPPLTFARAHRNVNRTSDTIFLLNAHVNTFVRVVNWIEPIQESRWLVWRRPLFAINKITLEENLIMSLVAREVFFPPAAAAWTSCRLETHQVRSRWIIHTQMILCVISDVFRAPSAHMPPPQKTLYHVFTLQKSTAFQSPPITELTVYLAHVSRRNEFEKECPPSSILILSGQH